MDTKRIKGLEFHVESQDYFGTLATVLKLHLEHLQRNDCTAVVVLESAVEGIINDLMYLQENYKIEKK